MPIKSIIGFSEDGKTLSLELEELKPDTQYDLQIGFGFHSKRGYALMPFVIEFKTSAK